jgi:hypothetical protein
LKHIAKTDYFAKKNWYRVTEGAFGGRCLALANK